MISSTIKRQPPHMPVKFQTYFLLLFTLVVASVNLVCQTNVLQSDPIGARKRLVYSQIGLYIGPSFNSQGGTFFTNCNCEFSGGAKAGLMAGVIFERLTRSRFTYGAMLGYENRGINGRFREIEGVLQTSPSGRAFTVPITFLNEASITLDVLTVAPFIKYDILGPIYLRLGGSFGYVFSSALTHTKILESKTILFPNGEVADVSIPGEPSGEVILQEGPVPEVTKLQIGGFFSLGANFRLTKYMFLSPVLNLQLPFTNISPIGTDFSVRSIQFSLEFRHIL